MFLINVFIRQAAENNKHISRGRELLIATDWSINVDRNKRNDAKHLTAATFIT